MAVNEIVATVSIIIQLKAGGPIGAGTGFFHAHGDKLFLATNAHVMRDDKEGVVPDVLQLLLHRESSDLTKSSRFDVPLYSGTTRLWRTHATHPDADVALIEVDRAALEGSFYFRSWSAANFLPSQYPLAPGEDVFIMGFPLTFRDARHNLPVFRTAMIASAYPVPFDGQPFFLTDGNFHPGTSGSPVVTKPKSTWVDDNGNTSLVTGTVYYLIGVHSGTVKPRVTGGEDVGLGAAWYIQLVEDIASTF